jgi:predicted transcriptional regulator
MTEQLAVVLSTKAAFEFKALFEILQANFREHKLTHGAEEMMRLRAYEKLQSLVNRGMVEKKITATAKTYRGLAGLVSVMPGVSADAPVPV